MSGLDCHSLGIKPEVPFSVSAERRLHLFAPTCNHPVLGRGTVLSLTGDTLKWEEWCHDTLVFSALVRWCLHSP